MVFDFRSRQWVLAGAYGPQRHRQDSLCHTIWPVSFQSDAVWAGKCSGNLWTYDGACTGWSSLGGLLDIPWWYHSVQPDFRGTHCTTPSSVFTNQGCKSQAVTYEVQTVLSWSRVFGSYCLERWSGYGSEEDHCNLFMALPRSTKEVRSFVGLCAYYRRFVKGFADIARPLHRATEADRAFCWTEECQQAFYELKRALTSPPVLAYPNEDGSFYLDIDASGMGLGAVLSQVQDGRSMWLLITAGHEVGLSNSIVWREGNFWLLLLLWSISTITCMVATSSFV